ncbi:MAG: hypothetical protein ACKOEG_08780, partial [Chthoniobacterales bacterium]
MFFGNAKRERCDAKTNALVRWSVARDDEARLACAWRDFYIGNSRPRLGDTIAAKSWRQSAGRARIGLNITQVTDSELLKKSIEVARRAYAPYSEFLVGAVLVAKDGKLFEGCNVE